MANTGQIKEIPGGKGKYKEIEGGVEIGEWAITASNKPILTSWELEEFQKVVDLEKIPDMIFGRSHLTFKHLSHPFELVFFALDAVKGIGKTYDANLKVSSHENWAKGKKLTDILEKQYDWTFSTKYLGSILFPPDYVPTGDIGVPKPTEEKIDINKLKTQDPIVYYNEIFLFEDELGDNGVSNLNVRVRVMPNLFFALLRFWLRVDNVLYKVYETRIFHEFGKNYVLREFQHKEGPYEPLKQMFEKEPAKLLDANVIAAVLPVKEGFTEKIQIF